MTTPIIHKLRLLSLLLAGAILSMQIFAQTSTSNNANIAQLILRGKNEEALAAWRSSKKDYPTKNGCPTIWYSTTTATGEELLYNALYLNFLDGDKEIAIEAHVCSITSNNLSVLLKAPGLNSKDFINTINNTTGIDKISLKNYYDNVLIPYIKITDELSNKYKSFPRESCEKLEHLAKLVELSDNAIKYTKSQNMDERLTSILQSERRQYERVMLFRAKSMRC